MGHRARGWADLTPEERQRELLLYHDYINDLEARLDEIDEDGFKDRGKAVLNDFRDMIGKTADPDDLLVILEGLFISWDATVRVEIQK